MPFLSHVCANHTSHSTTTPHCRTHAHMHAHTYKICKKYRIITTKYTIIASYSAEIWTLRAADKKYLESFKMCYWRRMEKISWTDHVRNEEGLLRVNEQRNILHEIRKWKANWIGHILRRNCLPQRITVGMIKGGIEVTGR